MSKSLAAIALAALGLVALPASAACTYPRAPERIPDGATAKIEELVAAQKVVKQFDADIAAYTECLQKELDDAKAATPPPEPARLQEMEAMREKKHNAAVDEASSVAERFNEQVRIFKAKSKKE